MSMLLFIEEALRRHSADATDRNRTFDEAIARAKNGGNEFCVLCAKDMGFPAMSTHVDASIRFKDGAHYVECCGQVCAECAKPKEGSA